MAQRPYRLQQGLACAAYGRAMLAPAKARQVTIVLGCAHEIACIFRSRVVRERPCWGRVAQDGAHLSACPNLGVLRRSGGTNTIPSATTSIVVPSKLSSISSTGRYLDSFEIAYLPSSPERLFRSASRRTRARVPARRRSATAWSGDTQWRRRSKARRSDSPHWRRPERADRSCCQPVVR
jgi:hypothetical protein